MSIIQMSDYLADQDCPELCNNDAFTFTELKDADMDPEEYSWYLAYDEDWDNFADDWETHA